VTAVAMQLLSRCDPRRHGSAVPIYLPRPFCDDAGCRWARI